MAYRKSLILNFGRWLNCVSMYVLLWLHWWFRGLVTVLYGKIRNWWWRSMKNGRGRQLLSKWWWLCCCWCWWFDQFQVPPRPRLLIPRSAVMYGHQFHCLLAHAAHSSNLSQRWFVTLTTTPMMKWQTCRLPAANTTDFTLCIHFRSSVSFFLITLMTLMVFFCLRRMSLIFFVSLSMSWFNWYRQLVNKLIKTVL